MPRPRQCSRPPISLSTLANTLASVPLPQLLEYADLQLTRLVIARVILERRDPVLFAEWWDHIEREALIALAEEATQGKPS